MACSGLSLSSSSQYCSYSASSLAALSLADTDAVAASCAETGDGLASTPVSVAAKARLNSHARAALSVVSGAMANHAPYTLPLPTHVPQVIQPHPAPIPSGRPSTPTAFPYTP